MGSIVQWNRKQARYSSRSSAIAAFSARLGLVCVVLSDFDLEVCPQRNGEPIPDYVTFNNIALADTFQIHEDGDIPDLNVFRENNATIERQKKAPINVVIGNPPYSAGQKSANDINANQKYPGLDKRIAETYAVKSTATPQRTLYDSYLRAFRWAPTASATRR